MNPDRYKIIYNSKYDDGNEGTFDSSRGTTVSSSSHPNSPILQNQNYYYNKYHEGLLELAKGFLNILLNQLLEETMVAIVEGK